MAARSSVETAIGWVDVEGTERGIRRVHLPGAVPPRPAPGEGTEEVAHHLADASEQIRRYAAGEQEALAFVLDWDGVEPTHRHVLETLCAIAPYGQTVTYGELGRAAGVEDPRDIGAYMARNPLPLVVPCHRVVASDGLGGYGGGLELKRTLLELEGALPARLDLGVTI
ncbi:MAG TPA: methylated-DNA--[protein]-cysteine S-methyltransferase [Gaiellaceae bacterium]|nr:methylated-DNA--[protein]-cysteine S-methyltransferase [Gaiellaceae bacterium]